MSRHDETTRKHIIRERDRVAAEREPLAAFEDYGNGRKLGLLTDGEILDALDAREFAIDGLADRATQVQPCSVDLRIGNVFRKYDGRPGAVTLGQSLHARMLLDEVQPTHEGEPTHYELRPGEFALGATIERVRLPAHVLGRVEGRSSIGRVGLFVHITAGFIDPGFEGQITLEFFNGAPVPVRIPIGHRVCQIAFTRLARPCLRPYGAARGSKYVGTAAEGVVTAGEEKR